MLGVAGHRSLARGQSVAVLYIGAQASLILVYTILYTKIATLPRFHLLPPASQCP